MSSSAAPRRNRTSLWLWIVQVLLAVVFLFTGGSKLAMPSAVLAAQSHLPGAFMKFIGVCEILGALGLVLPGLFHVQQRLTPLAAACLIVDHDRRNREHGDPAASRATHADHRRPAHGVRRLWALAPRASRRFDATDRRRDGSLSKRSRRCLGQDVHRPRGDEREREERDERLEHHQQLHPARQRHRVGR